MNLARDAVEIFRAAIQSVQAEQVFARIAPQALTSRPFSDYRKIALVAVGKSALASACVLLDRLAEALDSRLAVAMAAVPKGYTDTLRPNLSIPENLEVYEGGHPTPDDVSVRAAERATQIARMMSADDLLLVAISGGGTAVCNAFSPGISIADAASTFDLLLKSGAGIGPMNAVRKHLSTFNGGRLAQAAAPADVLALISSDVPGNDLSVIAGGPVTPDPSTFEEAWSILERLRLIDRLPSSVVRHMTSGLLGQVPDTPGTDAPEFRRVRSVLVASNADARAAAAAAAAERGYQPEVEEVLLTGEAREAGTLLAQEAAHRTTSKPLCIVRGGETTVTVSGSGMGGRNQEVALSAGIELERLKRAGVVVLSGGTDGVDGPTPAAGGVMSLEHVQRARSLGLAPEAALANNDSHTLLRRVDGIVSTGPTHVNVMDLQIVLIVPNAPGG